MKRMGALALVILGVSTPALAQDTWAVIGEATKGGVWMMRNRDINNMTNQYPSVWVKTDYSRDATVKYRIGMSLYRFDCPNRSYRAISTITYDASGAVVDSDQWSEYQQTSRVAPPETMIEAALEHACPK